MTAVLTPLADARFDGILGVGRGRPDIRAQLDRDADADLWLLTVPALLAQAGEEALRRLYDVAVAEGIESDRGGRLVTKLIERTFDDLCAASAPVVRQLGKALTTSSIGDGLPHRVVDILDGIDIFTIAPLDAAVEQGLPYSNFRAHARDVHQTAFTRAVTASLLATSQSVLARARKAGLRTHDGEMPDRETLTAAAECCAFALEHPGWTAADTGALTAIHEPLGLRLASTL